MFGNVREFFEFSSDVESFLRKEFISSANLTVQVSFSVIPKAEAGNLDNKKKHF